MGYENIIKNRRRKHLDQSNPGHKKGCRTIWQQPFYFFAFGNYYNKSDNAFIRFAAYRGILCRDSRMQW